MVDECRWHYKVLSQYKIVLTTIRILHYHTQSSLLHQTKQFDEQLVEILSVLASFKYHIGLLADVRLCIVVIGVCESGLTCLAKKDTRKKSHYQVIWRDAVEKTRISIVAIFYRFKQIIRMVGFSEVILNVIIFGWYAKFYKFILEYSALLKEAMHFTFYLHNYNIFRMAVHHRLALGRSRFPLAAAAAGCKIHSWAVCQK